MRSRHLKQLNDWLQNADRDYLEVQESLKHDFTTPHLVNGNGIIFNKQQFIDWQNQQKAWIRAHELWHRHLITIVTSDKYSVDAKWSAAEAWSDYMSIEALCVDPHYSGCLSSDGLVELGNASREAHNTLVGVMEAFSYNLDSELNNLKAEIAKQ